MKQTINNIKTFLNKKPVNKHQQKLITNLGDAIVYINRHKTGKISDLEHVIDKKLIENMKHVGLIR